MLEESFGFWVSIILAASVLVVLLGGLYNRATANEGKGLAIGWQFIRYTVIGVALPITALLAINDALSGEAATILAGSLGYAFGHKGKPDTSGN